MRESPFAKRYEDGQVGNFTFSRVSFDTSHLQALVYCEYAFGYLNGGGYWYWLEYSGGHWIVHSKLEVWVA
jgi:hypothetical protein